VCFYALKAFQKSIEPSHFLKAAREFQNINQPIGKEGTKNPQKNLAYKKEEPTT